MDCKPQFLIPYLEVMVKTLVDLFEVHFSELSFITSNYPQDHVYNQQIKAPYISFPVTCMLIAIGCIRPKTYTFVKIWDFI